MPSVEHRQPKHLNNRAENSHRPTLSAALGLAVITFSDAPLIAGTAVFFRGLGASLGFFLALSAAGGSGPDSAARVSLVVTIGYVAFLVGLPVCASSATTTVCAPR